MQSVLIQRVASLILWQFKHIFFWMGDAAIIQIAIAFHSIAHVSLDSTYPVLPILQSGCLYNKTDMGIFVGIFSIAVNNIVAGLRYVCKAVY